VLGDGGSCRARWVVAADGHYSPVRRRLAPAPTRDLGTWYAFRQYWSGVDERRLWVIFEEDLLPGYAWVFPLAGGRANVGFGVLRGQARAGKALASLWHSVLERSSLRAALGPRAAPHGGPVPPGGPLAGPPAPAATSRAGCSRTIRARSPSRRGDGDGACSARPARTQRPLDRKRHARQAHRMPIDFTLSPDVEEVRARVREFMDAVVRPAEEKLYASATDGEPARRDVVAMVVELREKAREW